MTNEEFKEVSRMLKELEQNIVHIFRDKELEMRTAKAYSEINTISETEEYDDCPECEKSHDPNMDCLEAGAIRLNV